MKLFTKIATSTIVILTTLLSSVWGAFVALDMFVIKRAQSEVAPVKAEMHTHYTHINDRLGKIDKKLDRALGVKE